MRAVRASGFVIVAVCALAIFPALASAAPPFSIAVAKASDGPFHDSLEGPVNATVKPGKTKSLFWKITSHGGEPHTVTLEDSGSEGGLGELHVKWFRGRKDISSDVKGSGYDFTLAFDHPRIFRARVKSTGPGQGCLGGDFSQITPSSYSDDGFFAVNNDDACV